LLVLSFIFNILLRHRVDHMSDLLLQSFITCGWITCLLLAIGTIFGTYPTFTGHTVGGIVYGSLRHMSWAAAVLWLVYCCYHRCAGTVFDLE